MYIILGYFSLPDFCSSFNIDPPKIIQYIYSNLNFCQLRWSLNVKIECCWNTKVHTYINVIDDDNLHTYLIKENNNFASFLSQWVSLPVYHTLFLPFIVLLWKRPLQCLIQYKHVSLSPSWVLKGFDVVNTSEGANFKIWKGFKKKL